jgi:hypothetical protein
MDPVTRKRILKFVEDFRAKSGTPPTLKNFETGGFSKDQVEEAVKSNLLEMFYINLTNGSVVKTYKIKQT